MNEQNISMYTSKLSSTKCWCGGSLIRSVHELYGKCTQCGTLVFLNQLTEQELIAFYGFDSYWHKRQTEYHKFPPLEQRAVNDFNDRIPQWYQVVHTYKPQCRTILEIGCAHGGFLAYSRERGIPDVVGVEVDESTCKFARERFKLNHVLCGFFPDVNLPYDTYDCIAGFDVLEHFPNQIGTLTKIAEMLSDDGVCVFQTPCYRYDDRNWPLFVPDEHIYLHNEKSIRLLFDKAGLEVVDLLPGVFIHDTCIIGRRKKSSTQIDISDRHNNSGWSSTKPTVVIDGAIFQIQAGRDAGIIRIWKTILPLMINNNNSYRFVFLQRGMCAGPDMNAKIIIAPYYNFSPDFTVQDERILGEICHNEDASIFISTYYTHAPGILNLQMVYDMIPEVLKYNPENAELIAKTKSFLRARSFVSISESSAKDLLKFMPVHSFPSSVAYPGLQKEFSPKSFNEIQTFKQKYNITKPYFLLVGNRRLYKNGNQVLSAFRMLPDNNNYILVAIGGEKPDPSEQGLGSTFLHIPKVTDDELACAYSGAIALAYPSLYEGFGLPPAEAIACQCPVITTKSSSLPEATGGYCLYVAPSDILSITDAMTQCLNKDTLQEMLHNGQQYVKKFTWERMADDVTRCIQSSISNVQPVKPASTGDIKISETNTYLVSAIVSTYKSEIYIRDCLDDLLNQTIADKVEIIVIDSASPENEGAIVNEYMQRHSNIVYIRTEERERLYKAWSRGIQIARGKYVTSANTDDRHRCDAFEVMSGILDNSPNIGLVYADVAITAVPNCTLENAPIIGELQWADFDPKLMFSNCYIGPQPMWRRSLHEQFGYFDDSYTVAGDYDFWLRLSSGGVTFQHIPRVLGLYLSSPSSIEHRNATATVNETEKAKQKYWNNAWGNRILPYQGFKVARVSSGNESINWFMRNTQAFLSRNDIKGMILFYQKYRTHLIDPGNELAKFDSMIQSIASKIAR